MVDESDSHPLWRPGLGAPLNLAAYITWLAIALQAVRWPKLAAGDVLQMIGAAALLAMMLAYLIAHWPRHDQRPELIRTLVYLQIAAVLLATWCLRNGGPAVLLIIIAAQVISLWPMRRALVLLALTNLALLAIWLMGLTLASAVLSWLPMLGFQAFAGLTVHYAMSREQARAALAASNAQLRATQCLLEDSARTGERLRLSRELHDVAGHKLTALKLHLQLLLRDSQQAEQPTLRLCLQLADELLSDIRGVVSTLRLHDGIDLPSALKAISDSVPGTRIVLYIDPALRVNDIVHAGVLLRCAQEGITNALRHGRAERIELTVERVTNELRLSVRHAGAKVAQLQYGNGLTGMDERLRAIDGRLEVKPLAEGGVELTAAVPAHG